ncbi:IPT/TIG domain-containing protein [Spongiimicrobium sp. 3-5]|uniref:NHL domain-containing protein n=1 Tax=Spongiimicrobium sp. 3-5 TaxID=3332596 RepID=UPI0039806D7B
MMRVIIKLWGTAMLMIIVLSCSKDDNTVLAPDPVEQAPDPVEETPTVQVSSISPTKGTRNTLVTINGNNFGNDPSKIEVYFNDNEGAVQSVNNTQITALVPQVPIHGVDAANVAIVIEELLYEGPKFTYIPVGQVSTFAGSKIGDADGTLEQAKFHNPIGVTMDNQGNIYVADTYNHKIRRIDPNGDIITLVGSEPGDVDGIVSQAKFNAPKGIAIDADGNIYIADHKNHKIKKITNVGFVTTLAGSTEGYQDGKGSDAEFAFPQDIALDTQGNVYVTDGYNNKIRKITPDGTVTTLAGGDLGSADGLALSAQFFNPHGIALDANQNIYVADQGNHKIRKITPDGMVSTLAGSVEGYEDGVSGKAKFQDPSGIATDVLGNVYVSDELNFKVRKISPSGIVSTLAGSDKGFSDGEGAEAQFDSPNGIVVAPQSVPSLGTIFVIDSGNHRIRKITQK